MVNMAVELNGQPPIQVYIRPTDKPLITIHSIDLGLSEVVKSYEDIDRISKVGSAFAIPKAALKLAGFHPEYSMAKIRKPGRSAEGIRGRTGYFVNGRCSQGKRIGHQFSTCRYDISRLIGLLFTGLGQARNGIPHTIIGTDTHDRRRMAGPVWRLV